MRPRGEAGSDVRMGRVGFLAIALAIVGGVLGMVREIIRYRDRGTLDWGHVALAVGVPILMYAIVRGTTRRRD